MTQSKKTAIQSVMVNGFANGHTPDNGGIGSILL